MTTNMPVAVYMPVPPAVHKLALRIKKDGVSWMADGRSLIKILDILGGDFHEQLGGAKGEQIADEISGKLLQSLKELDDAYGWDHPDQTEAEEDEVLAMFLAIWMMSRGIAKKYALRPVQAAIPPSAPMPR